MIVKSEWLKKIMRIIVKKVLRMIEESDKNDCEESNEIVNKVMKIR